MDALEERGAQVILVHTGQHYDPAMSEVFFDDLGIRPYLGEFLAAKGYEVFGMVRGQSNPKIPPSRSTSRPSSCWKGTCATSPA